MPMTLIRVSGFARASARHRHSPRPPTLSVRVDNAIFAIRLMGDFRHAHTLARRY